MEGRRPYTLRKRGEQLEATRRRITEATIDLHRTVGPAATQITEIARRAGVQRRTVYNHFPDDASLFAACSAEWRASHPAPDPRPWLELDQPGERLRRALPELYGWYRETEPMTANVLRDAELLPALGAIVDDGLRAYLDAVRTMLAAPFHARGRRRARIDAATRAAVDFHFWKMLAPLGDVDAAVLAAALVEHAAKR